MKSNRPLPKRMLQIAPLFFLLLICTYVRAGSIAGGVDTWKEELLLEDGSNIVLTRLQTYGGRSEPGQQAPIMEHTISFEMPLTGKKISWTSDFGEDIGRTNFNLLAVHISRGTPYVVAEPNLCLSYNKWGRPNPPYIIFKYVGNSWQRIDLKTLPTQFKSINVSVALGSNDVKTMVKLGFVSADAIQRRNSQLTQSEYHSILREPVEKGISGSSVNCEEMVFYKGAWVGPGDSIGKRMMDRRHK